MGGWLAFNGGPFPKKLAFAFDIVRDRKKELTRVPV